MIKTKNLLIDGRKIEIGKRFSFFDIKFSVIAFVKEYVFGHFPKILLFACINLIGLKKLSIDKAVTIY